MLSNIPECQNSTYGSNCSGRCGHCANDLTCEHVNGTCADGCQTGWLEPFCNSSEYNLISIFSPCL